MNFSFEPARNPLRFLLLLCALASLTLLAACFWNEGANSTADTLHRDALAAARSIMHASQSTKPFNGASKSHPDTYQIRRNVRYKQILITATVTSPVLCREIILALSDRLQTLSKPVPIDAFMIGSNRYAGSALQQPEISNRAMLDGNCITAAMPSGTIDLSFIFPR